MQFSIHKDIHRVSRIAGPFHNLLGLGLVSDKAAELVITKLDAIGPRKEELSAEDVQREVLQGVRDANAKFNTSYSVSQIQFVVNDTPPVAVYEFLAYSIVQRLAMCANYEGSV
jgi:hypothetical protein